MVRKTRFSSTEKEAADIGGSRLSDRRSKTDTRKALLDAAEQLMRDEGYASVTSRRVAKCAEITHQLVHYHFANMDDLFLSIWRRTVERNLDQHQKILASENPLRALWDHTFKVTDTGIENEFNALARHREAIRDQMVEDGIVFRKMKIDLVSEAFNRAGLANASYDAEMFVVIITNVARGLIMESTLGMTAGHEKVIEYFESRLGLSMHRDYII